MGGSDSNYEKDRFVFEDPCVLFTRAEFLPNRDMSLNEKLNALIRLALVIAVILFFAKFEQLWWIMLLTVVLIAVVLKYVLHREGFSTHPTYNTGAYESTSVAPAYAGEAQDVPVRTTFDHRYDAPPNPAYERLRDYNSQLQPEEYPYAQYITRTNLLPREELYLQMYSAPAHRGLDGRLHRGGQRAARHFANNADLRRRIAQQEDATRMIKKRLNSRFRHRGYDFTSPFVGY